MKAYVMVGTQPLEFPEYVKAEPRRVEPSPEGTPFNAEMDPAFEARLIAGGAIRLAEPPAEEPRSRRGVR